MKYVGCDLYYIKSTKRKVANRNFISFRLLMSNKLSLPGTEIGITIRCKQMSLVAMVNCIGTVNIRRKYNESWSLNLGSYLIIPAFT